MKYFHQIIQLLNVCLLLQIVTCLNGTDDTVKVLSRKKRFLTFPEGSSLQFVFCTQSPVIMPIGDIMQFSETIALAWVLPQNFDFLKKIEHKHTAQNKMDTKHIYYLDENGRVLDKVPYHRKPIVNPAFAKRSIDRVQSKHVNKIDKKNMHRKQTASDYLKSERIDGNSVTAHRENRLEIYRKLEKVYEAAGYQNARQCVVQKLCEASKLLEPQGTFFDELLKAVFTFPKNTTSGIAENDYDIGFDSESDCDILYKDC